MKREVVEFTGRWESQRAEFVFMLLELKAFDGLRDRKYVTAMEQLAIFLSCMHKQLSNGQLMERWQHSGSTISTVLHLVKESILTIAPTWITDPSTKLQRGVVDNKDFYPWFQHCIGAIYGSHILVVVRWYDQDAHRNRKKRTSQNCMFGVDFDTRIRYVLSGWEGSAHDGRVFRDAEKKGFIVPDGKYVLADAGYGKSLKVITPYKGVIYHLSSWGSTTEGGPRREPRDRRELFNYRHAQARNVVERTFGIMKSKWWMLREISQFDRETQASIIICCSVLHNMRLPRLAGGADSFDVEGSNKFCSLKHQNAYKFREWLSKKMWKKCLHDKQISS